MLISGQAITLPTSTVENYPDSHEGDAHITLQRTGNQSLSASPSREALVTARQQHSSNTSRRPNLKLLWIPHKNWPGLDGQRERCLLDNWPDAGDELHILTWQPARDLGNPLTSLGWSTFQQGYTTVHSRPRIPNVMSHYVVGRFAKDYVRGIWPNEQLFRFYTRQLVRNLNVDVLVYGIGHKAVGLPPFDLPIPKVFDYLDLIIYPDVEATYIANSDLMFCTSRVLIDRLQTFGKQGVYIPNGVSTSRIASGQRDLTRAELGLQGKQVVSLIGLTSSPSLFFIDALALAAREIPNIVFLAVGGGDLLRPIVQRCQQLHLPCVTTGQVPHSEVANYFAATDLGLYAGDPNPYFDAACPIKVLEYTAARRPVVATDLEELRRIAFPNVRLSPPDAAHFASAIITSLREPTDFADASRFEWAALAQTVRQALIKLIQERRQ